MAKEMLSSDVAAVTCAAIHLLRRIRKVDEASGLSAARLSALSVLVSGGATTIGGLARAEQVSAPTMSRLVSGLERDGFVVRETDEGDARAVRVRATAKGTRVLQEGGDDEWRSSTSCSTGCLTRSFEHSAAAEIMERVL